MKFIVDLPQNRLPFFTLPNVWSYALSSVRAHFSIGFNRIAEHTLVYIFRWVTFFLFGEKHAHIEFDLNSGLNSQYTKCVCFILNSTRQPDWKKNRQKGWRLEARRQQPIGR